MKLAALQLVNGPRLRKVTRARLQLRFIPALAPVPFEKFPTRPHYFCGHRGCSQKPAAVGYVRDGKHIFRCAQHMPPDALVSMADLLNRFGDSVLG